MSGLLGRLGSVSYSVENVHMDRNVVAVSEKLSAACYAYLAAKYIVVCVKWLAGDHQNVIGARQKFGLLQDALLVVIASAVKVLARMVLLSDEGKCDTALNEFYNCLESGSHLHAAEMGGSKGELANLGQCYRTFVLPHEWVLKGSLGGPSFCTVVGVCLVMLALSQYKQQGHKTSGPTFRVVSGRGTASALHESKVPEPNGLIDRTSGKIWIKLGDKEFDVETEQGMKAWQEYCRDLTAANKTPVGKTTDGSHLFPGPHTQHLKQSKHPISGSTATSTANSGTKIVLDRQALQESDIRLFDANGKPFRRVMVPGVGWTSAKKLNQIIAVAPAG